MKKLQIIKLISLNEAKNYNDKRFGQLVSDSEAHLTIAKKYIIDNNIRENAIWHHDRGIFLFNDNTVFIMGKRQWACYLAYIWSEVDERLHEPYEFHE